MAPAGAAGRAHGPRRVIVRPRPHWVHLLFVRRGSMVRQILTQQLFTVGFALLVALAHGYLFQWKVTLTASPNVATARTSSFAIASETVTVTQAAAPVVEVRRPPLRWLRCEGRLAA